MYTEEQQEKKQLTAHEVEIENAGEKYQKYDRVLDQFGVREGSLIKILHAAQEIFGFLPREVLLYTARKLGIPFAEIYGIVSFYSLFSMKPRGEKTIEICMGTACYVKGAEEILDQFKKELDIEPGEISADGKFTIETSRCVGACSLAPVVSVDEKVYSKVKPGEVKDIIEGKEEIEEKTVEIALEENKEKTNSGSQEKKFKKSEEYREKIKKR